MALLRFLVIAFLIYLGFKLVVRFVLPFFAGYMVKKVSQNLQEEMTRKQHGEKVYQDGHVTIRKSQPGQSKDPSKNEGEYVDFQEVD